MLEKDFWSGVRDTLPLMFGVIPFGLAYGVVGLTAGLTPAEVCLMSAVVFAGAAQFVSLPMFAAGAGLAMISFTAFLINLRHLLMGASLAPYMARLPLGLKGLLAFGMADETYAVTVTRVQAAGYSVAYQLGSNATGYVTWTLSTIAGVALGGYISDPLAWGLDFAMPATFLALLIPRLKNRTSVVVGTVAAFVSVVAAVSIPGKWNIILACLVAVTVGGLLERGDLDASNAK